MGMKTCTKCQRELPTESFYARRPDCKECVKARIKAKDKADPEAHRARNKANYWKHIEKRTAYHAGYRERPGHREKAASRSKEWRAANPERSDDHKRKSHYGMEPGQYTAMFATQDGKCAICGTTEAKGKGRLHVDHCHSTGKVRALLCNSCNLRLGHSYDSIELLQLSIEYLVKHQV
jgi:Recombination endonuclease VII